MILTSLKKSWSSQMTEQSGDATRGSEGEEGAREGGEERRSSTARRWHQRQDVSFQNV